ncbi:MAG: type II secretion system F family protein [Candidatus Margulisiibacteriota bacterium]
MPLFNYKGFDKNGRALSGALESVSKETAADTLRKSELTVVALNEKKDDINLKFVDDFLKKLVKVKTNDLVMVTIQLANMLDAGIPLPMALNTLVEQTENTKLKDAIADISSEIKEGKSFSDSLAKYNNIFSNLFISMVAAGEMSGNLDEVLKRLATFTEREAELKQKISAAMTYPVILIVAGIGVVSFVVTSVVPPFVKIFQDAGIPLPLPTLILYQLNNIIRAAWLYIIVGVISGFVFLKRWAKTPHGKLKLDEIKIKVPVWGDLSKKVEIARLTRTLAALLTSGVPMLQALQVTEKTIDLAPMADVIRNVGTAVGKGKSISESLKESGQFPVMPIHMIAVGEDTGTLETMLNKIADFYDIATDYAIKKLTALLEPLFLVIIGGLVGFIFASILLPIFSMVKTLGR